MARRDIVVLPEGFNEKAPNEFYCWGDISDVGIVSKKEQVEKQLQDAFDSITIEEDETTPETDYVLKVLGKDSGARIIVPFDSVVKDAYFDKITKDIVFVIVTSEGDKEIRVNVSDLIDTYTGDDVTIRVKDNIISITEEVMDKFTDLQESIASEEIRAESIENSLKKSIDEEILRSKTAVEEFLTTIQKVETDYKEADSILKKEIEEELSDKTKDSVNWQYSTEERKHIVLDNHDSVLGTSSDGSTYNVAMVSKWDVVDIGSNKLPLNLNSTDGKITVNDDEEIVTTANTIPLSKIEALFN